MKIVPALLFAVLLLASCSSSNGRKLPYYSTADFTPHFEESAPAGFHEVRPFKLTAHTGSVFTEKDMDGKISVVNFFFTTCPGICPRMAASMRVLQDTFLNDNTIQLLSHSVTPEKDSVPILQKYAAGKKVNSKRWLLLTGDKAEIYNLGRKYYFVEQSEGQGKDTSEFLHTENFILVDKQRHLRGIYNGLSPESINNLIADIRELEKE